MTPPTNDAAGSISPKYLVIGEILRPHGVAGELRMRVLTAYPERLSELDQVYLHRDPETQSAPAYRLESVRLHQGYMLLKLQGVDSRSQADQFRESFVLVALEDAVPLAEGEVYLYQLIGLEVQTEAGLSLGKLVEVLETGANDVYIVDSPRYGEILIPATAETILSVNPEGGLIVVKLPDGLLPEA